MTIFGSGSEEQFLFSIADMELEVVEFSIQEEVSSPFTAFLTVASEDEIGFDDVIGREALLTLRGDQQNRFLHGIIYEFMLTGSRGRFYLYRTRVVPSLWLLSLEQDCRIFQNKSVPDIVKQILEDRQIPSDTFEFRLKKEYQPREYCVQYRETDLNFISRLLEEEGPGDLHGVLLLVVVLGTLLGRAPHGEGARGDGAVPRPGGAVGIGAVHQAVPVVVQAVPAEVFLPLLGGDA
ncbi:MAG: type VI secretion system tip protein VgrG, partial [Deltaproteobacteria bacterium]|nr:type VI secretion system tip protein VgrG [Deltaproteobacteria bacterium]